MSDVIETAVNWDHETGEIVISTRRRGVVSKLKRLGLSPSSEDTDPTGYTTFRTSQDVLRLSFRGKKTLSDAQRAKVASRLAKSRRTRSGAENSFKNAIPGQS